MSLLISVAEALSHVSDPDRSRLELHSAPTVWLWLFANLSSPLELHDGGLNVNKAAEQKDTGKAW